MTSWEGGFGWQEYALSGRPDFLNYLHSGDVTWEKLWEFYRRQPAAPRAAVVSPEPYAAWAAARTAAS